MGDSDPDLEPGESDAGRPADQARRHLRQADRGYLATLQHDAEGAPYASLVLIATDHDASPLLLISELADHTKNLRKDGRASLLIDATAGLDDPLTGSRVSLLGTLSPCGDAGARDRYLRRQPSASLYAGFGDFGLWRMAIGRAHLVAGFGRIHWVAGSEVSGAPAPELAAAEAGVVDHMNSDHADALDLYAGVLLGLEGSGWRMTGCDSEGIDLRLGGRTARLPFDRPVTSPREARTALVELVRRARAAAEARP